MKFKELANTDRKSSQLNKTTQRVETCQSLSQILGHVEQKRTLSHFTLISENHGVIFSPFSSPVSSYVLCRYYSLKGVRLQFISTCFRFVANAIQNLCTLIIIEYHYPAITLFRCFLHAFTDANETFKFGAFLT